MLANTEELAFNLFDQLCMWRRQLHMYPELGGKEHTTAKFIRDILHERGITYKTTLQTGTIVIFRGTLPGKTTAIRADIDALPIQEENSAEYCSRHDGVMHACGHDMHTAILLGIANILSSYRDYPGTVILIFQPSEEVLPGGAKPILDSGILDEYCIDAYLALHVNSTIQTGYYSAKSGPNTASIDTAAVEIISKGGHSSKPHLTDNPIIIGCSLIQQFYLLQSDTLSPYELFTLSATKFHSGTAVNVIPDKASIELSFRCATQSSRRAVHERLSALVTNANSLYQCDIRLTMNKGYPPGFNDFFLVQHLHTVASNTKSVKGHVPTQICMAADDFAYYSDNNKTPTMMFWLGVGNTEKGIIHNSHSSLFDCDEQALPIGVTLLLETALQFNKTENK